MDKKVVQPHSLPRLLLFSFLALFLFLTLFFPSATGLLGRFIQWLLFSLVGSFAYVLPLLFLLLTFSLYYRVEISLPFGLLLSVASLFSLGLLQAVSFGNTFGETIRQGGGILGWIAFLLFTKLIGRGGFVLLLVLAWFFLLLYFSPLFQILREKIASRKKAKPLASPTIKSKPKPKQSAPPKQEKRQEGKGRSKEDQTAPKGTTTSTTDLSFPPLDILKPPEAPSQNPSRIKEQEKVIQSTLAEFGVEAEVCAANVGPRITRFELQPAAGVKVREVVNLTDDLSLHLALSPIRIEAPIPGKSAIGIEVPNPERSTVYLKEIVEDIPLMHEQPNHLMFALGKDTAGSKKTADLTKMPHLLIAGATGSGKSVCLNTLISSLLFKALPSEVRFLMIDPKRVELTLYNKIPHLLTPVITDTKQATQSLEVVLAEMEERYDVFAKLGVRNIQSYNEKSSERIPYWVIIIDELADLMFQSSLDTERYVCRIAQLSRATGIHLVIATQRPSVNVITGLIKANIPSRIAFAVASQTDSRVILDMNGAEKLLGAGDMLFLPVDESKPQRYQGVFISEEESRQLASFWQAQTEPDYDLRFEAKKGAEENKKTNEADLEDVLLPQALEVILTTKQASASLLQRKLRIGYARAGRMMDILERQGIVGAQDGSKPREILLSDEALYQMIQNKTTSLPEDNLTENKVS